MSDRAALTDMDDHAVALVWTAIVLADAGVWWLIGRGCHALWMAF